MVILIVDDEPKARDSLTELFKKNHELLSAEDGAQALDILKKTQIDLVITDHLMKNMSGLELIKTGKLASPTTSFILVTAFGTIDDAVQSIKLGADDYLLKPIDFTEIEHRVNRISQIRTFKTANLLKSQSDHGLGRLIGKSRAIVEAKEFVSKVADVSSCVLLLGPSGSGKEIVSRAIHEQSSRAEHPFVAVNCASFNEQLIESELFGHEKGAFTGASQSKPGKFELAYGGTIFLDEIGEMPIGLQAKLLRVLQDKEFYRVGGLKQIKTNARVIAATNRNLKEMIKNGSFREDLYFRLNVLSFEMQKLSNRSEDIPILIEFFWNKFQKDLGCKSQLTNETLNLLEAYSYPGNIRELQNVLERLAVLSGKNSIVKPEMLPSEFHSASVAQPLLAVVPSVPILSEHQAQGLNEIIENIETKLIVQALEEAKSNQVKAAARLKISRGRLQYKLKKMKHAA